MILRGYVDRGTRDLDFFGLAPSDVDRLAPAAVRALREAGLDVRTVQATPGFVRLVIEGQGDRTELDLGADARLFPAEPGLIAPTLVGEELAVDKVLAVSGRAEARDFVDLLAVEGRYGLPRLFELAAEKDRGFTPDTFGAMLDRFERLRRDEFDVDDRRYEDIRRSVVLWREQALELSRHRGPEADRNPGRGR